MISNKLMKGRILQDEKGTFFFLPNKNAEVQPGRLMLKVLDENHDPKIDDQGRTVIRMFDSKELLQSIRENRMKFIGFID